MSARKIGQTPTTGTVSASAEVVVVGAGICGLIAAWQAAGRGAQTLLVDASPTHPPASRLAAGMIAPVGEASWGEEHLLPAIREAADRWPGFADRLAAESGCEVPYARRGSLHVALDRDEAAELRRRAALLERLGLDAEAMLGSESRRLEPGLATSVGAAIHAPGEAEVEPRALCEALEVAARQAGATWRDGEVRSIDPDSGRVELAGGAAISAGTVVLAAGAWSGPERIAVAGLRLPIRPVRGEILRLRGDRAAMPCERIVVGERCYVVPRANGEVVVGATSDERGFDARVTAGGVHELLREAYRALPELAELEFVEAGAGLRPGSPDNAPIVGRLRDSRLIVAGGAYRNGILLAPLLALAVEAALAAEPMPEPLRSFGPDRFAAASSGAGSLGAGVGA